MVWFAAVIVLLLFIFSPKKMFTLAGVVLLIFGVIGGYTYYDDWKNEEAKNAVTINIEYSPESCKEPYPLQVFINNSSARTVFKVEWDVSVKAEGFSSELADYKNEKLSQDKILKPKEGWWGCAKVPRLKREIEQLSNLHYSVKNKFVIFENDY
ncbi:hypothetical protein LFREDSHE_06400 [Shewanella baltica]